jgi:hypothetical protein
MSRRIAWLLLILPLLTALACNALSPATPTASSGPAASDTPLAPPSDTPAAPDDATTTPGAAPATATATAAPSTEPSTAPPITGTPPPPADLTYLAYIRAGQLLVANVTGGVAGGATQYTSPGVDDAVYDLVWSPSGEFIAFTSFAVGVSHLFVVYAEGAGTPVDLGPGSAPNWSPNSLELAFIRDDNLWITPIDSPAPRQLTFQSNWGWGRPTFLPDGSALVVTGTSRDNMGAQGNTQFMPQILSLDGSGTLSPLAAFTTPIEGRLPYDLRFSPDNSLFAFSSSFHLSACAGFSDYYVANADGSSLRTVTSPSLAALEDPASETYLVGTSYAWAPNSQALLVQGQVMSCAPATIGSMLGVQVSLVGLDGAETFILPGFNSSPSFSPDGQHFAVAAAPDFVTLASRVQIFDFTGSLILDVDDGYQPVFQPPAAPAPPAGARPALEIAIQGVNHVDVGVPHDPYNSEPPTSGPHYAQAVEAGIYDEAPPDEYLVHNMEHGHVILWYNCSGLSVPVCDDLKQQIRLVMAHAGLSDITSTLKLVAVPRPTLDTLLALTAWGRLQTLDAFDADTILAFIQAYRDQAPEPGAP